MRFEKINDNQIRCTLTRADLQDRHIGLSELTYGGEKARNLFDEMLEKALIEHNFDTEDLPVMIEAIPMAEGNLTLLITKMEDPEELDTRFSHFTAAPDAQDALTVPDAPAAIGADEILKLFSDLANFQKEMLVPEEKPAEPEPAKDYIRVFSFRNLDSISEAAVAVEMIFTGESTLYKDPDQGLYYLAVTMNGCSPEDYNRTCNILSEFGKDLLKLPAGDAYYKEHFETIIAAHALQALALI